MIEGDEAKHAAKALRLTDGDEVELCDGHGSTMPCRISAVDKSSWRMWLQPLEPPKYIEWAGPEWVLAVACLTLKGGRSEWLVEKATELGARELIPLSTERSQMAVRGSKFKVKDRGGSRGEYGSMGRLERVAIAATKQSLRPHGLVLHPPVGLDLLCDKLISRADVALLAAAGAPPALGVLHDALRGLQLRAGRNDTSGSASTSDASGTSSTDSSGGGASPATGGERCVPRVVLLVGPEGDFTPEEVEVLAGAGALPVGLGHTRLRTETAAVALLALCALAWECKP